MLRLNGHHPGPEPLEREALLASGYQRFHDPFSAALLGQNYRVSFHLRFADPTGTRYVIAIHQGYEPPGPDRRGGDFYSPDVQFTRAGLRFSLELLMRGQSLREVEAFVLEVWRSLRCDYLEGPDGEPCYPQPARR